MSLSTHGVYREVITGQQQDGSWAWFAKLLRRDGTVEESLRGTSESDESAKSDAKAALDGVIDNYKLEVNHGASI